MIEEEVSKFNPILEDLVSTVESIQILNSQKPSDEYILHSPPSDLDENSSNSS